MCISSENTSRCEEATERVDTDGVWRIARALVKQKGSSAPVIAAHEARKLLECGEIQERLTWMRVMAASKAVLAKEWL